MRRLRFSLRTLLVATTFLAMALTIVILAMKLFPLQAEVQRLRNEVGYLTVDDPTKVHAIRVATVKDGTFRYRIWIPNGGNYCLLLGNVAEPVPYNINRVYRASTDGVSSSVVLDPGEHLIDVHLTVDKTEDELGCFQVKVLLDGRRSASHNIAGVDDPFYFAAHLEEVLWEGVGFEATSTTLDQSLTLLFCPTGQTGTNSPFLMWIAEE